MKIQWIGFVASVLMLLSLTLPWWTASLTGFGLSFSTNIYLYNPDVSTLDVQLSNYWIWLVFVLILTCGLLGLAGSIGEKDVNQKLLMGGGILTLLSLVIFAGCIQFLVVGNVVESAPLGLFYSASYDGFSYVIYLSYGFWLALAAAILMFFASTKT